MILNYFGMEIKYSISNSELVIYDSYKIRHAHYSNILVRIRAEHPDNPIWESRSKWGLECEWAVHNLLYKLGIKKVHAKDVNLDVNVPKKEKLIYNIFGSLLCIWK